MQIASVNPAEFLKPLNEQRPINFPSAAILVARVEDTYLTYPPAPLRPRRQRPSHRAAEARNELPPSHSITSSARTRREVGNVMPSALATLKFRDNRTFVDC